MLKIVLMSLVIYVLLETLRYSYYKKQLAKGLSNVSYRPSCLYVCIVDITHDALVQISNSVSKGK